MMAAGGTGSKGGKKRGTGVQGRKAKQLPLASAAKFVQSTTGPIGSAAVAMASSTADAAKRDGGGLGQGATGPSCQASKSIPKSGEAGGAKGGPRASSRSVASKLVGAAYFANADKVILANHFADIAVMPGKSCTKAGQHQVDASWKVWQEFIEHCPLAQAGSGDSSGYVFKGVHVMEHWPPSPRLWMLFHGYVRENVSSHSRYLGVVNDVARVGRTKFVVAIAEHQVAMNSNVVDPTILCRQADQKMRQLLGREYGKEVEKVLFINMEEARNGHRFIDQCSAVGLQDAGLWNFSCVSGGRRPRTYTAIRLKHVVEVKVEELVDKSGGPVLMVSFAVVFDDEKYMDPRGPRRWCDPFVGWSNVWDTACLSASYFLYPMLVYRGALTVKTLSCQLQLAMC